MGSSESDETLESYGAEIGVEERGGPVARFREWVLVEGNRLLVAVGIAAAVFLLLLVLNRVGIVAFVNDSSITRLAGGMIAGTFSLVTLVVSINQLILSQEFASAEDARTQLDGVMEFRNKVADTAKVPASPASPAKLLDLIVESIRHNARILQEELVVGADDEFSQLVDAYTNRIEESTDSIDDVLEKTKFGTFETVSAAVAYDSAWQLYVARNLRNRRADSLSDDAAEAFDDLIDALEQFSVAQEHFKTTYLQRELTRFSQLTVYTGVPAILSAMFLGFVYADFGGPTVSAASLPFLVSGVVAVVVTPLALLVSYILRTATVTRRTASVGPMLPQKDPEAGPFSVSYGETESGTGD
ncbi:hypothetical protein CHINAEXTREME_01940 [Halobiforma lacisalsi AJ5]|uniref:Uncharacterized protein n=1 Tax=Natronobacterium lacisalsi AJ5 TaxID=358396 RepID=M0LEU5_NATLA|nr:hypothetical protein [Halobiforma lacisalsi]APW96606.1 hypothetical protein CHINAEXTREME_01940 [Halobiforma lacisalsi AJ5]EMA32112.1 hypothetical protein C445_12396 [Halobiforma lacisalsi AJ5]